MLLGNLFLYPGEFRVCYTAGANHLTLALFLLGADLIGSTSLVFLGPINNPIGWWICFLNVSCVFAARIHSDVFLMLDWMFLRT